MNAMIKPPVSFDDLDDLDAASANTLPTKNVTTVPCYACGGSGTKIIGYRNPRGVKCFVCNGTGKTKPDAKKRKDAWRKGQETHRNNLQAKAHAFAEEYPDVMEWLFSNTSRGYQFAVDLLKGYNEYGSLTEGQIRAVRNSMARSALRLQEYQAAHTSEAGAGGKAVLDALTRAVVAGKGRPKMRTEHATFSLAKATSKNAGCVYVVAPDKVYLGKITPEAKFIASRDCSDERQTAILEVLKDPLEAAVRYGRLTGNCSCCGRVLNNKESIELGIGPICRSKMFS